VLSAQQSITIGRKVLMARNVYVADHMHAFADIGVAVLEQGIDRLGPVEIGDGAWLGQNVVVGPGVRIGRGTVVGANSVVLGDLPEYSVAVGSPARVVRRLASGAVGEPAA
jgi:acetyltransferase-like isoleucine patch superfamily enzyme